MGRFVWIASYPKSGSTWLRAFLNNYIRDLRTPYDVNDRVDLSTGESGAALYHPFDPRPASHYSIADVQRMRPLVHRRLAATHDGLFFVKTHNALLTVENISLITPEVTAGAIYIVRDPRDIAVSYSLHLGRSLDETIDFMADTDAATGGTDVKVYERLSSWSAHVHFWTRAPNPRLHVMRYEDMVAAPETQFGAVIRFLGQEPNAERLRRAAAFSAFGVLAAQENSHGFAERPTESQAAFFRVGKPGQWRDVLTASQALRVERQHDGLMRRFGYL
jgi:hypothetical protein